MTVLEKWQLRPSEFDLCIPEDDLTMMTAYLATKADMEAYDHKLSEDEAEMRRLRN